MELVRPSQRVMLDQDAESSRYHTLRQEAIRNMIDRAVALVAQFDGRLPTESSDVAKIVEWAETAVDASWAIRHGRRG